MSGIQVDPNKVIDRLRADKDNLSHQNMLLELAYLELQEKYQELEKQLSVQGEHTPEPKARSKN